MNVKRSLCLLAVVALAGCSSASASPGAGGPTVAGNKSAAARYASHLVSLARIPTGAKSLHSAPPSFSGPAAGRPSGTATIDDASYYEIPMSFSDALAWLKAFKPGGRLHRTGTSGGGGPGYEESGVDFSGATNRAWQSADLELIVESESAKDTYLRVDAVVVWLDPVPVPDTATGPRIHFTVAAGCPATDKNQPDVTNAMGGLDRQMLPAQPPTRALLCRYSSAEKLVGHRALIAAKAGSAAASIRKIPLSHVDGASYGCPADFGTEGYAAFDYSVGQTVDIRVGLSGCEYMSNGEITAMADTAGNLFPQVSR